MQTTQELPIKQNLEYNRITHFYSSGAYEYLVYILWHLIKGDSAHGYDTCVLRVHGNIDSLRVFGLCGAAKWKLGLSFCRCQSWQRRWRL